MNALLESINPFLSNSAPLKSPSSLAGSAAASSPTPAHPVAAAVAISDSALEPARAAEAAAGPDTDPPDPAAELFSEFAARNSMQIISPARFNPDMDALFDAILPPEPPLFLRKPSPAFLRAIFELAGDHQ